MPRPLSTPGKDPVPIAQETGWAPGPVWTVENLAPPGFDPRTELPVTPGPLDSFVCLLISCLGIRFLLLVG